MAKVTLVTCEVKKDLFLALDKLGVKSKKAFCEEAIESAIHKRVQDTADKFQLIDKFINFGAES